MERRMKYMLAYSRVDLGQSPLRDPGEEPWCNCWEVSWRSPLKLQCV